MLCSNNKLKYHKSYVDHEEYYSNNIHVNLNYSSKIDNKYFKLKWKEISKTINNINILNLKPTYQIYTVECDEVPEKLCEIYFTIIKGDNGIILGLDATIEFSKRYCKQLKRIIPQLYLHIPCLLKEEHMREERKVDALYFINFVQISDPKNPFGLCPQAISLAISYYNKIFVNRFS
jgi:hypothetical protein